MRPIRKFLCLATCWLGGGLLFSQTNETEFTPPGCVEFAFELPAAPGNPFERDVWAEVTPPGAPARNFPAFHDGGNLWRVRVRASAAGKYELGAISEKSDEVVSPLAVSAVGPRTKEYSDPPARPAIGIDPANPRGFRREDGAIYYPVGMNIAWGKDYYYPRAFADLAEAGGNWTRLWMAHWGGTDLSWHEPEEGPSPAPGLLDLDVARRWDRRLAAADAHGIYVQMVFQHHGQFSSDVNPSWPQHPWNRANGGFLANAADFFTDPTAIRHTRWKYRYIVARHGWSPAVLAWELFNEVHFTDAWKNEFREADVVRWHAEMAAWIRANDVYRHLITTSTDNLGGGVWRSMDYYQPHLYAVNMLAHARRFPAVPRPPDKPLFYGELGDDSQFFANPEDKASGAGIMPPLWSGLMADGVLPPQPWYWDRLLGKPRWAEYVSWAQFIQAARLPARHTGLQEFTPVVETAARVPHVLTAGMTWAEREPLDLIVPDDGREPAALADVPDYYVPPLPLPMLKGHPDRVTLRFNRTHASNLKIHLKDVGAKGPTLAIELNGVEVRRETWPAYEKVKPDQLRPVDLAFTLPAGPQILTLRNLANDAFRLGHIDLDSELPALAAVGRRSESFLMLYAWHRGGVTSAQPAATATGEIPLETLPAGRWRVTWWNMTGSGAAAEETISHPGGTFRLKTPAISRHAAMFMERLP